MSRGGAPAHDGDAYGCCVPALTRFASHHRTGPPRLALVPHDQGPASEKTIMTPPPPPIKGNDLPRLAFSGSKPPPHPVDEASGTNPPNPPLTACRNRNKTDT